MAAQASVVDGPQHVVGAEVPAHKAGESGLSQG
jgi:hypothetical protein